VIKLEKPLLLLTPQLRQFLALVEFESRNKKKASKATHDFTERFHNSIQDEEQGLKKHIERLGTAALATSRCPALFEY
jgi:hypothetical protein